MKRKAIDGRWRNSERPASAIAHGGASSELTSVEWTTPARGKATGELRPYGVHQQHPNSASGDGENKLRPPDEQNCIQRNYYVRRQENNLSVGRTTTQGTEGGRWGKRWPGSVNSAYSILV